MKLIVKIFIVIFSCFSQYNIRQEVLEAARITKTWKNKAQSGQKLENYVVRRYVGTVNGLFLSYPGTIYDKNGYPYNI